jgi:predicted SAM-dependent methyltransferase
MSELLRLHVGGVEPKLGWKILNIQPGPAVDFVGDCANLSRFPDGSVAELYASHVYEHLGYQDELPKAFAEVFRVLVPGGHFKFSVPDLETLSTLILRPGLTLHERLHVMRMMFGGQTDPYDFHKVGLTQELAYGFLGDAGFRQATRVTRFGLFDDTSDLEYLGVRISLNIDAIK